MGKKPILHRRPDCRLCGGTDHELVLRLEPTPLADAYVPASRGREQQLFPLDLFLCKGCGHSQLLDVIDPEVLYRDYIYVTTSSLGLAEHFGGYAASVLGKLGTSSHSLVVDVGSNDGTLLRHFKGRGMKVLGIEPAREIAASATRDGVETLPEFFGEALAREVRAKHGPASVITMNNLFANIDGLRDVASGVRALLAPDGVFVFETFYFVDYVKNLVFDFMYHEHLSYFTVQPLSRFFGSLGMEIIDVERVPTKGGSIRCMVQLAGGPRQPSPSVAACIAEENAMGIQQPGARVFRQYADRIEGCKRRVRQELDALKSAGKRVAAYGASATSTTLIYHFGLTGDLEFIVDDNPSRQGTVSPGCHIPVVPSTALLEKAPDAVVLLAWRYRDPILKRNRAYLERGGRFLIPLPEFSIC
jgi:SAM-dependent methyltransferase